MLTDFFSLALNNLKRRKLRSWLTMLGIFIGIAAVVALISLGQGLQTAVTGQFSTLSTDKLTIQNAGTGLGPPGSTVVEKLNEHDLNIIKKVSGVNMAVSRLIRIGKVKYNNKASFEMIGSLPVNVKEYELVYNSFNAEAEQGRLLKKGDSKKILVGHNYLKKTKFGKKVEVGKKLTIEGEEFEVVGISKASSTIMMNDVILMFEDDMKEILDIGDETDLIVAQVKNPKDIEKVAEDIEKALRKDRDLKKGEEDFSVETPIQAFSTVNQILNVVNIIVVGIAMISLLVGGIGIANTMYTSVLERKKEIGTMKAVGAKNSDVLYLFLIESGLLGLVGGIIGAVLGAGAALGISSAANSFFGGNIFQINLSIPLISFAIGFSFLIGIVSGAVPSYQASKLKPAEALRG